MNEEVLLVDLKKKVQELECEWITRALDMTNGNCTKAADLLGLTRTALVEKRKKYGFRVHDRRHVIPPEDML